MTDHVDTSDGMLNAIAERLASRTTPGKNGCVVVMGYQSPRGGHPRITVMGHRMIASRAAWMLHHRQAVPEYLVVRHTCDNAPCVARDHLILGTQAENMQDMVDRKRYHVTTFDDTCRRGHARTPENTRLTATRRTCLDCERAHGAARKQTAYADRTDARRRADAKKQSWRTYVADV